MPAPDAAPPPPPPKPASFLQVVGAVFWSFLGIRKGKAMARDTTSIKPLHVIGVGVILAAIFVLALVGLVQLILRVA